MLPVISGVPSTSISSGNSYQFQPTVSDVDAGDTLSFSIQNLPSWATFDTTTGLLSSSSLTSAETGTYSNIVISVSDGTTSSNLDSFSITVVDGAPAISAIANVTQTEDTASFDVSFSLTDSNSNLDSLQLSFNSSNQSIISNSGFAFSGSGASRTLTLTPLADAAGQTTVSVTVTDETSFSSSASFVVTITEVNDLPTISAISPVSTNEDTQVSGISFSITDVETNTNELVVSVSSSNTSLVKTENILVAGSADSRTLSVTPELNQSGSATVSVTVTDASSGNATTQFEFTVNAVNDLPVLAAIENVTTLEETSAQVALLLSDVDHETSSLVVSASSNNQTLVPDTLISINNDSSGVSLSLTPATNQFGTAQINVTAADTAGGEATTSFVLTVTNVNDSPVITADTTWNATEDQATTLPVTLADVDNTTDNLVLTASSSNSVLTGVVSVSGTGDSRTLSFTPTTNLSGQAVITLAASDGSASTTQTINLTVAAQNDAPTLVDDSAQTEASQTVVVNVLANDSDVEGDTLSLTSLSTSVNGSASIINNQISYTPVDEFIGTDQVSYTVSDGNGGVTSANLLVAVSPIAIDETAAQEHDINGDGTVDLTTSFDASTNQWTLEFGDHVDSVFTAETESVVVQQFLAKSLLSSKSQLRSTVSANNSNNLGRRFPVEREADNQFRVSISNWAGR